MEIKIKPEWNGGNSCPSQRYGKKNNGNKIIYTHIIFKQRYICTNGGRLYTDVNNVMTHSMNISKIDRRIRS